MFNILNSFLHPMQHKNYILIGILVFLIITSAIQSVLLYLLYEETRLIKAEANTSYQNINNRIDDKIKPVVNKIWGAVSDLIPQVENIESKLDELDSRVQDLEY
jgi:peptidoglycan hydrolase CwlO-like protein